MALIKRNKKSEKVSDLVKLIKDDETYKGRVGEKGDKGDKGDRGDTPTDRQLLELIRPLIPKAKDGKDGRTYTVEELISIIRPLIPTVKDGETPSDDRLIALIKPLIVIPDKELSFDDLVYQINGKKDLFEVSTIKGLAEEINRRIPYQMIGAPRIKVYNNGEEMSSPLGSLNVKGSGYTLSNNGQDFTLTITGGGGGGGSVDSVVAGTGIDVNIVDPANPIVSLNSATLASLGLANSALQSGDNISELVNNVGYLTSYTETDTLATVTGRGSVTTTTVETTGFIKTGGTSAQFLKADGSVDSTSYYPSSNPSGYTSNTGTVTSVTGTTNRITSTGGATPVIDISASYVGQSSITTLGTITTGVWNGTAIGVAYGGTNIASYAVGDLLQASASTTLSKLAAVATGNVLISGGVTTVSSWGKVGLTTHISGILGPSNGGTGFGSYTQGDILYADTSLTIGKLVDVATGNALISGGVGAAPSYGKIGLTTHISGTLGIGNGGTNATSFGANRVIFMNSGNTALSSNANFVYDGTGLGLGTSTITYKFNTAGTATIAERTWGINGTIVMYLPNQTSGQFLGSMFIGDGGRSATAGAQANLGVGTGAGLGITSGSELTYIGYYAGSATTTAIRNVYIGTFAGGATTTGSENLYMGYAAGYSTTTGGVNTAIGGSALRYNQTGGANVAIGYTALYSGGVLGDVNNTVGIGYSAGFYTTGTSYSVYIGMFSGYSNTTGATNTIIGAYTGYNNQTGSNNTYVGFEAGFGVASNSQSSNSVVGKYAMFSVTTGSYSSMLGTDAGYNTTSGDGNIFIGYQSGYSNTTGGKNILIGYAVYAPTATTSNFMSLGNTIFATGVDGTGTTLSAAKVGILVAAPTAVLHVGASTTGRSSIRIDSGTAPSSPNNGDMWFDGTDVKFRTGGVTKTFTLL